MTPELPKPPVSAWMLLCTSLTHGIHRSQFTLGLRFAGPCDYGWAMGWCSDVSAGGGESGVVCAFVPKASTYQGPAVPGVGLHGEPDLDIEGAHDLLEHGVEHGAVALQLTVGADLGVAVRVLARRDVEGLAVAQLVPIHGRGGGRRLPGVRLHQVGVERVVEVELGAQRPLRVGDQHPLLQQDGGEPERGDAWVRPVPAREAERLVRLCDVHMCVCVGCARVVRN